MDILSSNPQKIFLCKYKYRKPHSSFSPVGRHSVNASLFLLVKTCCVTLSRSFVVWGLCYVMPRLKGQLLSHVQLFGTPWTGARQAPLSMGFPRQEYWSGLPFPSPGDLPDPGMEPESPELQADSLPSEPAGKCLD